MCIPHNCVLGSETIIISVKQKHCGLLVWVMTLCSLAGGYQCFRGFYHFHVRFEVFTAMRMMMMMMMMLF
jgi:hypothetical protein